ncbi:helix-turn-helix domain-containing protein [Chryseobacterium sp. Bi04]|uniref:helix-turn-helix domain-containing protein n=1 Tax=Chryseobacterium sp. Bi04 TaxID=2822345 RepID=UPI001D6E5AAC|nr:helix-turn-helix domain-containing protein [Chryseobacterium sp. Bi04]CAH0205849.1 hypothetical protein SRABI04_02100 [Chryseobacterium sp. Bi04]
MESIGPDYVKIFSDIITKKFPEKISDCRNYLRKERLSSLEVITLNRIIFHDGDTHNEYKSYDYESIAKILEYQRKNKMTNIATASAFKLSRNTLAAWKKMHQ